MCTVYLFVAVSSEAQRVPSAGVPVQRAAMQATGGATAASPEPELPPEPTEEGIYQGLKWLRGSLISAVAKTFSEVVKFGFRGSQEIKSLFSAADKMSFGRNALWRLFPVVNFLLRFSNGLCKIKTQEYGDNMRATS